MSWLLPSSDEVDVLLHGFCPLTAVDGTTDALCNGLEHWVMSSSVSAFPQSFWAATQYVLKGSLSLAEGACWCIDQAPAVQVGWAGKGIVDSLEQELDAVWLCPPELSPRDLPLHNLLPSSPGTLLRHSHCSAGPLLLCSHLILDELPIPLPFVLSKRGVLWFLVQPFLWPLFPPGLHGVAMTLPAQLQPLLSTYCQS